MYLEEMRMAEQRASPRGTAGTARTGQASRRRTGGRDPARRGRGAHRSGYAGLTMDRVARRAGTNKNAIYRRWPNRAALGIAAYRQLAAATAPIPDTGELRGDALELMRRTNRNWSSSTGGILRALLAGARDDPQLLAQIQEHSADAGSAAWLAILARAVARGEAPAEALHLRVATAAIVLLRNEFIVRGYPTVPDDVLVEIVDEVYLPLIRGRGGSAEF